MTKSLKYLSVFDPDRDIFENWRKADPLNYAWFAFSRPELQERYRDSGSKPPSFAKSLQFEMRLELRERISNGEFIAFGIQTSPLPNSVPEQIPKPFFAASSIDIDWDHDHISGLGLKFHEVRLSITDGPISKELDFIKLNSLPANRGGGRPSRYPEAKEILEILFRDEKYRNLRANSLCNLFNKEFKLRFAPPNQNIASVSERSLRDYLKRYRKELAEIGRD